MPGKIDIGGYFEQLIRRGRGGRRIDDSSTTAADDRDAGSSSADAGGDGSSGSTRGGGFGTRLKDAVGRGKAGAGRTVEKVKETAKQRPGRSKQPPLVDEGIVTIEYSPRQDGDPDPGEVVWAWVPFEEDHAQGKDRPVAIIGRRGSHLVGVPLTTKRNEREAQVNMGTGGWDPKRRTSYARVWRLLDVAPDSARREGSVLDVQRFEALVRAVDEYYDVKIPSKRGSKRRGTTADDYDY
jgi:hypothetical protein